MIFIFCALHCEAKPLIEHYSLKRNTLSSCPLEIFANTEITLIITGVGRMAMAFALCCVSGDIKKNGSLVLNIGSAGSAKDSDTHGSLYLIHKVEEVATGRQFFPDLLIKTHIPETSLQTFDSPVTNLNQAQHLVDMEASAFMQTAQRLIPVSHTAIIKFVSDKLSMFEFKPARVTELCRQNLPAITAHLEQLHAFAKQTQQKTPMLSAEELSLVQQLSERLRLTQYMQQELQEKALSYKVRHTSVIAALEECAFGEIEHKEEAKQEFRGLINLLNQ